MQDISLHVLDIVENSIEAGATQIKIMVDENITKNLLTVSIVDNGKGIGKKMLPKVLDPFYTTKRNKRVGLGLSLFAQSAKETGGHFNIESVCGSGTTIVAQFVYNHIDRRPLGKMDDTLMVLIGASSASTNFIYQHKINDHGFIINTKDIKKKLGSVPINNPEVMDILRKNLASELKKITAESLLKEKI